MSPPQQSPTTPKCSTPVRQSQQCKSPVGGQDAQKPIDVSSQCEPSCTNYWVKEFCLTEQDRVDLFGEEWLNDRHINAANKLLQSQYPTANGLQDPLVLYQASRYRSGKQHFVQVLNISQSHWVCVSDMLSPPGVVEVYDSMPAYSQHSSVLKRQVAVILQTPHTAFELRHVDVQRQLGGADCGLYALAFATALFRP